MTKRKAQQRDSKQAAPAKGLPVKGGVVNRTADWGSRKGASPLPQDARKR
jgi:hypothetical protein